VTGGAGFIGSNLVDGLLARGDSVTVLDNLTTGRKEFLTAAWDRPGFEFVHLDLLHDAGLLPELFEGADAVVHLAANADVRHGWAAPRRDLEQNVLVTLNVLDAMAVARARRLVFASTGSVYGEARTIPTPETAPFPVQTSLYGASKASAEHFIAAHCEAGRVSATAFRFVSILGPRYTHGHVIDFVAQLTRDPTRLRVLGDGTQRKSYLDVTDCVAAMLATIGDDPGFEVFNLGVDDFCAVTDSVGWIVDRLGLQPSIEFAGGRQGWLGDNPFIFLDTTKIRATGWSPRLGIREAVERTVDYLVDNRWLLEQHGSEQR
jgi:UDP-glucose 4-epimerase